VSYAQYRFTDLEALLIEKYFPRISSGEDMYYDYYVYDSPIKINFSQCFLDMMGDSMVMSNPVAEFWVFAGSQKFVAKPEPRSRNIWEYYLALSKGK